MKCPFYQHCHLCLVTLFQPVCPNGSHLPASWHAWWVFLNPDIVQVTSPGATEFCIRVTSALLRRVSCPVLHWSPSLCSAPLSCVSFQPPQTPGPLSPDGGPALGVGYAASGRWAGPGGPQLGSVPILQA